MKNYSDYESITENETFNVPLDMFKADVKKYLDLHGKEQDGYVNCLCIIWLALTTLKDAFGFSKGYIGIPEDTIFDIDLKYLQLYHLSKFVYISTYKFL